MVEDTKIATLLLDHDLPRDLISDPWEGPEGTFAEPAFPNRPRLLTTNLQGLLQLVCYGSGLSEPNW